MDGGVMPAHPAVVKPQRAKTAKRRKGERVYAGLGSAALVPPADAKTTRDVRAQRGVLDFAGGSAGEFTEAKPSHEQQRGQECRVETELPCRR
jgi:hypothetical protein